MCLLSENITMHYAFSRFMTTTMAVEKQTCRHMKRCPPITVAVRGWTLASMCRPQFAHILCRLGINIHIYGWCVLCVCVRRQHRIQHGSSMKPSQLSEYYYYHSSEIIIKQQTYSIMRQWGMCNAVYSISISIYLYREDVSASFARLQTDCVCVNV